LREGGDFHGVHKQMPKVRVPGITDGRWTAERKPL